MLLFVAFAVSNWGMMGTSIGRVEAARDLGYAGARLGQQIQLDVVQVWQWLTNIGATRAAKGLNDGFDEAAVYAETFRRDVKALRALHPDRAHELDALRASFDAFYAKGQRTALAALLLASRMTRPLDAAVERLRSLRLRKPPRCSRVKPRTCRPW